MAPSRGKGKALAAQIATSPRRGARRGARSEKDSNVPDVYQSLLEEATDEDVRGLNDRPFKKRKVAGRLSTPETNYKSQIDTPSSHATTAGPSSAARNDGLNVQTVEESSEDEGSDLEFEDVDLDLPQEAESDPTDGIEDLSIAIEPENSKQKSTPHPRRKPPTYAEKAHRLLVHKLHVLCLLGHCMYLNGRCNNAAVQKHLLTLLPSKTLSYLKPRSTDLQFQRNRSFMDGLQQAVDAFTAGFRVLCGGLTKPHWEVDSDAVRKYNFAPPLDRADFIAAAKELEGSQDTGNQLFCALLRSAGVNARLVCSLQVLPYTSMPKQTTPKTPTKTRILAIVPDSSMKDVSDQDTAVDSSSSIGSVPSARRRLGQPTFAKAPYERTPKKAKSKTVPKLSYPVFWVEAFNNAQQKWIAVDALVTHTINRPSQLEPPASYEMNQMTYAIAFEPDGTARDVTKRYAKAYNAKTRRHRVETSPDGIKWMKKALRIFRRRGGLLDRDQVEDSELAQKESREGMPANVLDFKGHPYYALERHLRRHEVIHPLRQVGKVNAGTAAKPRIEPVYRAQDVFICKSADKWYRLGREIREGEQPLKHIPVRSGRQKPVDPDELDRDGEPEMTGLYAAYQTQVYVPPPVQRGRVPRNVYGNLDIYVPSMVPAGGVHIRDELAQQASKLLRVDYADAVVGFKFQGRHGTAIVSGVVVAEQYADAVRAVIEGMQEDMVEEESKARSLIALRQWKRFLTALRIADRVSTYAEGSANEDVSKHGITESESGLLYELGQGDKPLITAGRYSLRELTTPARQAKQKKRRKIEDSDEDYGVLGEDSVYESEGAGGFFVDHSADEHDSHGGFLPDSGYFITDAEDGVILTQEQQEGGGFFPASTNDDQSGGFFPADDAGGFIPDDNNIQQSPVQDKDGGYSLPQDSESPNHDDLFEDDETHEASRDTSHDNSTPASREKISLPKEPVDAMDVDQDAPDTPEARHEVGVDHDVGNQDEAGQQDDSDKASILSHDPDDDDAEPDWLESD